MAFDWIDEFLSMTDNLRSPESFRLWTGISTLAAVLERRVWTVTDVSRLYPNQYIILAGGPASGKTVMISLARELLLELSSQPSGLFLGPDNPTKASFLDQIEKSSKISLNGMGVPLYSAIYVMCMEFGVLISKYEKDFIADLTHLYDNPKIYTAPRRASKDVTLDAPTINLIAAATPDALGDTIPEVAWSQGFTSRFIFIYGKSPEMYRDPFSRRKDQDFTRLKSELDTIFHELHGEFIWDDDAQDALRFWLNDEQMAPVPDYGRLTHYVGRRNEHIMKLSMVSAISAGRGLAVSLKDFKRAQRWLFDAEEKMPDVFRAMAQKSDQQLLHDAWHALYVKYSTPKREDRKPLTDREVFRWFEDKVPHDKIESLVKAMERTGRIRPVFGSSGEWIPNTLDKIQEI